MIDGILGAIRKQTEDPMFLGGLGLLSGEGMGGMQAGMEAGQRAQLMRKRQEEEALKKQRLAQFMQSPTLSQLPKQAQEYLALNPDAVEPIMMEHLKTQMDPTADLRRRRLEAETKKLEADAVNGPIDANLQRSLVQAQINALNQKSADAANAPSFGEKAVDRNFAKTYEEDIASGSMSDAISAAETLGVIATQLESPTGNLTGPYLGLLPNSVKSIVNPTATDMQDTVANIVQRTLRPILGAQFTQQEGENLIKRAYNPQLEEAENAKRIKRLAATAKKMIEAKLAASKYFEQHGTLKGFNGSTQFSIGSLYEALDAPDAPAQGQQAAPQSGAIKPGTRAANQAGQVIEWNGSQWVPVQ